MVVTLGALLADVAHTPPGADHRPRLGPRAGRASSASARSSYEGPTGIVGVVHDACRRRGLTSASLWAAVPHYVAAVPNPKAALALLRRLEGFTGIAIEASELEDAMSRYERQVDRAVASNPEIEELVHRLEEDAGRLHRPRRGRPLRRHDRPRLPALPAPALGRAPPARVGRSSSSAAVPEHRTARIQSQGVRTIPGSSSGRVLIPLLRHRAVSMAAATRASATAAPKPRYAGQISR